MSRVTLIACVLAMSTVAYAQAPVVAPPPRVAVQPVPPPPPIPPVPPIPPFGDDVMMLVSSELGGRSVIKGAPYSATAVNESKQVFSDGNRIERSSTTRFYRDSQGRTRQEQASGVVFINDVVAGKRYVLNTQRKSARELRSSSAVNAPLPPASSASSVASGAAALPPKPAKPQSPMSPEEARSWGEEMRRWGQELRERIRGEHEQRANDRDIVITRGAAPDAPDVHTDHIRVIHMEGGQMALPAVGMSPPPGPGTTTLLGGREFDGVRADGKRTTWTIPAGRIGNKLPIEIVSERWYSPELNVVVLSRHADPRSGERIYRLENIKRDEPSAELFKVPADFTLKTRDSERK